MAASGVRISWLAVLMKSERCSSSARSFEISRNTPTTFPVGRLFSSSTGETINDIGNIFPDLVASKALLSRTVVPVARALVNG